MEIDEIEGKYKIFNFDKSLFPTKVYFQATYCKSFPKLWSDEA